MCFSFQAKNSDPSRLFNARGGQLLKDQQMQKQVKKDLAKLEKSLTSELRQWEEDCERYFIVQDSRYLDTIKSQWEETGKQKQIEIAKKVGYFGVVFSERFLHCEFVL